MREGSSSRRVEVFGILALLLALASCGGGNTDPQAGKTGPGSEETAKTATLESAANLIQSKEPISKISLYLDGFHAAKDDPKMQMEAHHYCNQVNEDFAQCALFDGNTGESRLMGVEYIISSKLYDTLPSEEKAYWHPRAGSPSVRSTNSTRRPDATSFAAVPPIDTSRSSGCAANAITSKDTRSREVERVEDHSSLSKI